MADDDNSDENGEDLVSWLSLIDPSDSGWLDAGRMAMLLALDLDVSLTRSNAVLAQLALAASSGEPVDRAELLRLVAALNTFAAQHAEGMKTLFGAFEEVVRRYGP